MSTQKASNNKEKQNDSPQEQKILSKLSASLQFFRKRLFPTQNEILDQQLRSILKAYNANDKQHFFRLISQFEKRRNVPFELTYYVLDTRKFFSNLLRDITNHPADKELVIKIVDALISSFENVSRERALKLLRFYQLLSCFDLNFVQVFTAKGGYEVLNKLLMKWNDEEFLIHIVVVLGSTIMFISKPKVEQYHSLKENIIDHAVRGLESKTSVEFVVQTLMLLFFTPDSIVNYERAVHLGIQAMNKYPNNRRVLHAAYFLLAIRVKELFTKFAPRLKEVLRPLYTNDLIHVTKNPPVPRTSYILDESAQLLLSPEYTNRSQVPELQTTELFFLEMAFSYLQKHDSPEELKYFLDNRIFGLIINEVKTSYAFAAFPFRALRAATKFMPTVYYPDIVNLTKKIMLSESAITARHTFTVLFSTLQFLDEDVIRSTAEETISTVFDKMDKNIKDKRAMIAGVTLLRLYFSISSSSIVEQIIEETGTTLFINMIKQVIADDDKDRMVEVLIMLKESATFSPCCREFFVSEKFIMSAIDIINAFLSHAEVLNKLIRLFVNSVSQHEQLFSRLFESPIFAYVTSIMMRYPKEENILDAGCKFLATYGLYELGRKSAHSLNIIRQLYDIIKDMESPVVIESALFTLVHFLSSTTAKSEHSLEDSQYEVLSGRLATVLCVHQDRPEMFKNASKVLYFICMQGKGHNIKEEHVKDILEGLDAYRNQPIDGREVSLSNIIVMLLTVTSLTSMKENPLNDKAYDFIMDVVKNNLDENFRLRFFMALSNTQITNNPENVTRLMDRGVLPILLEYIEHHLKHEQLGFAHNVMAKLCANPDNIPTVADHGMPLIFRSFQEQKNNDAVHHYGLKALAMMSQSDAIKRRFGRVSIALTLETMSTFIDIPEIVINGTVALFNLAVGPSPSVRIDMHTLHGINTLMKILRHKQPMVVKNNVILLLRVLCSYDENCIDFLEENGLEELLVVAKQYPEEKAMISEILVTIGVVVEAEYKNSQLLDYLKKSGDYIIQFARNALKMPLEIKTRAANLLSDLSFHNFLVGSILNNGGLGAVLDCYTMHADDVALVANVLRLLLNCSRTEAFYKTVSLVTVNTIIIPVMMTHLEDHLNDEETSFNQMYPAGFFANLIQFGGDYNKWHLDIPQLAGRILVVIEKHSSHAQLLYHCFRLIRDLSKEPKVVPIVAEKLDVLMSKLKDKSFNIEALQATGMELMAQICTLEVGLNQFIVLNGSEWMEQVKTQYNANQRISTAYEKLSKALNKV